MNYKRFRDYVLIPNERINILAGDNEVGKSSILEAIDIVAGGNIRRVEMMGIERLLNVDAVNDFMSGERTIDRLPVIRVELYLLGDFDHTMNGKNNLDRFTCDGIRLVCEPNRDYSSEIKDMLSANNTCFPYDYYSIRFSTFADEPYTGFKKKLRSVMIDNTRMNSEYATCDFIRRMYYQYTEDDKKERSIHKSLYRQMRTSFKTDSLDLLNSRIPSDKGYMFGLKSITSMDLENDLMIYENDVGIDSKGTGKQVFIKTDFALEKSGDGIEVILIEEPENHLSPVNLRKLIQKVATTKCGQLFVSTHSSVICTRLEINNLLIMHTEGNHPITLKDLNSNTAQYFAKTPPAGILEFVLAQRIILVEGPAEYMLMERFYESITDGRKPESEGVHVVDVRGLSFKRYLDVAKLTGGKVAVITDNDNDYHKHCIEKYNEYCNDDSIGVFYDTDNAKHTFELQLYAENSELCDELFGNNAANWMVTPSNKTEAAYTLLTQDREIVVPDYIKRAINWIRE